MNVCETIKKAYEIVADALTPIPQANYWNGREVYCVGNWIMVGITYISVIATIAIGAFGVGGSLPLGILGTILSGFSAHVTKKYIQSATLAQESEKLQNINQNISQITGAITNNQDQLQHLSGEEQKQLVSQRQEIKRLTKENAKYEKNNRESEQLTEKLQKEIRRLKAISKKAVKFDEKYLREQKKFQEFMAQK